MIMAQGWEAGATPRQQLSALEANSDIVRRGHEEISALMERAADASLQGDHHAAGVAAGIAWLLGQTEGDPLSAEERIR